MDNKTQAEVEAAREIETYKSLISISTEGFKALQILNGGAVLAVLTYLAQMAHTHPDLVSRAKLPISLFLLGLVAGTAVHATSYATQLALHNENRKNINYRGPRKVNFWLGLSSILCAGSLVLFAFGAFSCLDALGP